MRDKNITKYRKLLQELQLYCKDKKSEIHIHFNRTDFERGRADGEHTAYNDVLRKLNDMINFAECDWENVKCRDDL